MILQVVTENLIANKLLNHARNKIVTSIPMKMLIWKHVLNFKIILIYIVTFHKFRT